MASSPQVKELLKAAGMKDGYDAKVAEAVRDCVRKDTGHKVTKTVTWPGTPASHFPLVWSPTVNAMIQREEMKWVKGGRDGRHVYLTFA